MCQEYFSDNGTDGGNEVRITGYSIHHCYAPFLTVLLRAPFDWTGLASFISGS